MNILEAAIQQAGSVGKLAIELDVKQNVISNWRARKSVPAGWRKALLQIYPALNDAQAATPAAPSTPAGEVAHG